MLKAIRLLVAPLRCGRGATAIEYALLAGLIAAGIIGIVATFGQSLAESYVRIGSELAAAQAAQGN